MFDVVVDVLNGVIFTMECVTCAQLINLDEGILENIFNSSTNLNSISEYNILDG